MAVNKYTDHVLIFPEDDANRQLANGFVIRPEINQSAVDIRSVSGGWGKAFDSLQANLRSLRDYPARRIVLLIDFDGNYEERLEKFRELVPTDLVDRVFLVGVLTEPEPLRADLGCSLEVLGGRLARDCEDHTQSDWNHELLAHNQAELQRMRDSGIRSIVYKD